MTEGFERRFWVTETARKATILLLVLQLTGCALDLAISQISLISVFCLATVPDQPALETTAALIWLTLMLSWIVGLVAIWRSAARPAYWLLLLAIPISLGTQQTLLTQKVLFCDAP